MLYARYRILNNYMTNPNNFSKPTIIFLAKTGFFIFVVLMFFIIGGRYLDLYLDTSPWFLIGGFMISIFVNANGIHRMIKSSNK